MARRRSHRGGKALLVLVVLGCGIFGVSYWMTGGFGRQPLLIGEVRPDPAETGVRPSPPPEVEKASSSAIGAGKPQLDASAGPLIEPPAPPSTQPVSGATRPSFTQNPQKAAGDLQEGLAALDRKEWVAARDLLNAALHSGIAGEQADQARRALTRVADETIFSRVTVPNDPLVDSYVVMAGNSLGRLSRRYKVPEDFLAEINGIANKAFIREGARLKMVHGPFHAAISKSDHVMHLYLQDVYVRTFRVALGADGRTPAGRWKVANHQANPGWTDPRTGQRWHPDDPANPIGEYWIGLEGVEGPAVGQFGYGIHGTIEEQTIGQDVSLGCVRLGAEDIAKVYRLLVPGESYVTIVE